MKKENMKKWGSRIKTLPRRPVIITIGFIICVIVVLTTRWSGAPQTDNFSTQRGRVLSVNNDSLIPDPYVADIFTGTQILSVEILTGRYKGEVVDFVENSLTPLFNNYAEENMEMLFNVRTDEDGKVIQVLIYGYIRNSLVYILIGLFILLLIVIGRKKGLYSAIALAFTLIIVIFFMMPLILRGHSPIWMAIATSALTAVFTIFLISDISLKSLSSISGIVLGVAAAGIVGAVAGKAGHISGLNAGDAEGVLYLARNMKVNIPDLLFAGIIIAALGAVMDVSMSISSAIFEVKSINPELNMWQLYRSGMNIGRDIMGTMSNTLILAFAGSSINVLIIIMLYNLPYQCLINSNLFLVELIQGISGSIGLILTVPITAICAAAAATYKRADK